MKMSTKSVCFFSRDISLTNYSIKHQTNSLLLIFLFSLFTRSSLNFLAKCSEKLTVAEDVTRMSQSFPCLEPCNHRTRHVCIIIQFCSLNSNSYLLSREKMNPLCLWLNLKDINILRDRLIFVILRVNLKQCCSKLFR